MDYFSHFLVVFIYAHESLDGIEGMLIDLIYESTYLGQMKSRLIGQRTPEEAGEMCRSEFFFKLFEMG